MILSSKLMAFMTELDSKYLDMWWLYGVHFSLYTTLRDERTWSFHHFKCQVVKQSQRKISYNALQADNGHKLRSKRMWYFFAPHRHLDKIEPTWTKSVWKSVGCLRDRKRGSLERGSFQNWDRLVIATMRRNWLGMMSVGHYHLQVCECELLVLRCKCLHHRTGFECM